MSKEEQNVRCSTVPYKWRHGPVQMHNTQYSKASLLHYVALHRSVHCTGPSINEGTDDCIRGHHQGSNMQISHSISWPCWDFSLFCNTTEMFLLLLPVETKIAKYESADWLSKIMTLYIWNPIQWSQNGGRHMSTSRYVSHLPAELQMFVHADKAQKVQSNAINCNQMQTTNFTKHIAICREQVHLAVQSAQLALPQL